MAESLKSYATQDQITALNSKLTGQEVTVSCATGVTKSDGNVYKIGSLVIVQLRLSITTVPGNRQLVTGLPKPRTSNNETIVSFKTSADDNSFVYLNSNDGAICFSQASQFTSGNIIITGSYIT